MKREFPSCRKIAIEDGIRAALGHELARAVTEEALAYVEDAFATRGGRGLGFLAQALAGVGDDDRRQVELDSCRALAGELVAAAR